MGHKYINFNEKARRREKNELQRIKYCEKPNKTLNAVYTYRYKIKFKSFFFRYKVCFYILYALLSGLNSYYLCGVSDEKKFKRFARTKSTFLTLFLYATCHS